MAKLKEDMERKNQMLLEEISKQQQKIDDLETHMNEQISKRVGDAMKTITEMLKGEGLPVSYDEHKDEEQPEDSE